MATSARYGLRPKRQKTGASIPARDTGNAEEKVLTRIRGESSKLNLTASNQDTDQNSGSNNLITEPAPEADKISYPCLDHLSRDEASGLLYPALTETENTTPTKRKPDNAATTTKKSLKKHPGVVTPSLAGLKDSKFDFKPNSAIQMAGKKVLEGLKMSSAAVKAQMNLESSVKASPLAGAKTPLKKKKGRYSDAHRKNFDKMESIASHYSIRMTKPATTTFASLVKTPQASKRKAPELSASALTHPFKPQLGSTVDGSDDPESPLPARKKAKGEVRTPGGDNVNKNVKFAFAQDTPDKPLMACHLHGLSRSVSVKQATKKPLLPRPVEIEASPITPPKPVAIATPMKAATLLASPMKDKNSASTRAKPSTPGTPSPVKATVPISVDSFTFRHPSRLPVFPSMSGVPVLGTPAGKTETRDTDPKVNEISPRVLFKKDAIKRKAQHTVEDSVSLPTAAPKNKRVRLNVPVSSAVTKHFSSPTKSTVCKNRLELLATPKKRVNPKLSKPGTLSKPRWK